MDRSVHEHAVPPISVLVAAYAQRIEGQGLLNLGESLGVLAYAALQRDFAANHVVAYFSEFFSGKAFR